MKASLVTLAFLAAGCFSAPLASGDHSVLEIVSDRGQPGPDASVAPAFGGNSANGSRVFFTTGEPLVAADGDSESDVYERAGGVVTLRSDRVQAGADGAQPATFRGASSDGTRIFVETAEPLVAADGDAVQDVYERSGGTTKLVSDRVRAGADSGDSASYAGASADGARVFFRTFEPLVTQDGDAAQDIYERTATTTSLVSDRVKAGADSADHASFG